MLVVHPSSTCDVCLDRYSWEETARTPHSISCGHVFCFQCLQSLSPRTCPLCRRAFNIERIRKLHVDLSTDDEGYLQSSIEMEERQLQDLIANISGESASDADCRAAIEEVLGWLAARPPDAHRVLRESVSLVHRYKVLKEKFDSTRDDRDDYERKLRHSERKREQTRALTKGLEESWEMRIAEIRRDFDKKLDGMDAERQRLEVELEQLRASVATQTQLKFKTHPLPPPPEPVPITSLPVFFRPSSSTVVLHDAWEKPLTSEARVGRGESSRPRRQSEEKYGNLPQSDYIMPLHPSRTGHRSRRTDHSSDRLARRASERHYSQNRNGVETPTTLMRAATYLGRRSAAAHTSSPGQDLGEETPRITVAALAPEGSHDNVARPERVLKELHAPVPQRRSSEPFPFAPSPASSRTVMSKSSVPSFHHLPHSMTTAAGARDKHLSRLSGFMSFPFVEADPDDRVETSTFDVNFPSTLADDRRSGADPNTDIAPQFARLATGPPSVNTGSGEQQRLRRELLDQHFDDSSTQRLAYPIRHNVAAGNPRTPTGPGTRAGTRAGLLQYSLSPTGWTRSRTQSQGQRGADRLPSASTPALMPQPTSESSHSRSMSSIGDAHGVVPFPSQVQTRAQTPVASHMGTPEQMQPRTPTRAHVQTLGQSPRPQIRTPTRGGYVASEDDVFTSPTYPGGYASTSAMATWSSDRAHAQPPASLRHA